MVAEYQAVVGGGRVAVCRRRRVELGILDRDVSKRRASITCPAADPPLDQDEERIHTEFLGSHVPMDVRRG